MWRGDYFYKIATWKENVIHGTQEVFAKTSSIQITKKKKINGKQEHGIPPQPLSGEAMYLKMKDMIFSCGKKCGKTVHNEGGNDYWKRRPAFFQLPYWKHLHV